MPCRHHRQDNEGSNQWQSRVTCRDCGKLLFLHHHFDCREELIILRDHHNRPIRGCDLRQYPPPRNGERERVVEKIVEVPVEKIMEVRVPQIVEIPVQTEKVIEKIVRIPVQSVNPEAQPEIIERIVEVPKIIAVPKIETIEKVVEVERLVPMVDMTTPRVTKAASTQTDIYGCQLDVLDQLAEFEIIPPTRTTGHAASSAAASSQP